MTQKEAIKQAVAFFEALVAADDAKTQLEALVALQNALENRCGFDYAGKLIPALDRALALQNALRGLYDEVEADRQRRQKAGIAAIIEARDNGCASTFHPSRWAPTPAMLVAEDVLDPKEEP